MTLTSAHIAAFRLGLLDRNPEPLTARDVEALTEAAYLETKRWPPPRIEAEATTVNLIRMVEEIQDDNLFYASNYLIQIWYDIQYAVLSTPSQRRMFLVLKTVSDRERTLMCESFFPIVKQSRERG